MRLISAVSGVQVPAPPFEFLLNYLKGDMSAVTKKIFVLFIIIFVFLFCTNVALFAAEKKQKVIQKIQPQKINKIDSSIIINDSNLKSSLKTAEDLAKKGEFQTSLILFNKIYDYTKSVLTTINFLQKQYEHILNDPKISLNDKEYIMIRLQRMDILVSTYKNIKDTSAYYIGLISNKKGDIERARKYLFEVLESTPFDLKKDSMWMKTKSLLLEAYNLEGEF